jgi:hypothetical protein
MNEIKPINQKSTFNKTKYPYLVYIGVPIALLGMIFQLGDVRWQDIGGLCLFLSSVLVVTHAYFNMVEPLFEHVISQRIVKLSMIIVIVVSLVNFYSILTTRVLV